MYRSVAKSNPTTTNTTGKELYGEQEEHLSAWGQPSEVNKHGQYVSHLIMSRLVRQSFPSAILCVSEWTHEDRTPKRVNLRWLWVLKLSCTVEWIHIYMINQELYVFTFLFHCLRQGTKKKKFKVETHFSAVLCVSTCVWVCVERESIKEESYENHVRHAGGMKGGKSSPTMNEATLGEEEEESARSIMKRKNSSDKGMKGQQWEGRKN